MDDCQLYEQGFSFLVPSSSTCACARACVCVCDRERENHSDFNRIMIKIAFALPLTGQLFQATLSKSRQIILQVIQKSIYVA